MVTRSVWSPDHSGFVIKPQYLQKLHLQWVVKLRFAIPTSSLLHCNGCILAYMSQINFQSCKLSILIVQWLLDIRHWSLQFTINCPKLNCGTFKTHKSRHPKAFWTSSTCLNWFRRVIGQTEPTCVACGHPITSGFLMGLSLCVCSTSSTPPIWVALMFWLCFYFD